ncbi:hypothetical protein THAOC_04396 [Thalassiosira oceanica]|uniref:Uncharacterized protein n=1 Tax=Thalassiosira oceanica TaxID=159749 RepID=K0T5A7_THAOC|nr:hypothetical protein THAOC_04396 [Thalassiosira oceanica]|eukprot:EJK73958.1 hypothetical protein THAOC_04396 [Thalassiosira oceanica]
MQASTAAAGGRRRRRLSLLCLPALLLSASSAAFLAAASPRGGPQPSSGDGGSSGDGSSEDDSEHYDSEDEEYGSMIDHAMSVYLARSPGLVGRALREAGAEGVAMSTSVDGDGAVVAEDDFEMAELHQAEFAVEAVQRELKVLLDAVLDGMEEDSDDDEYDGDAFGYDRPYREPYVRNEAEGSAEEFRDASYGDMYGVNPLQRYNDGKMPGGKQSQDRRDEYDEEEYEDEDMYGFDHLDEYYGEAEREVDREMHEDPDVEGGPERAHQAVRPRGAELVQIPVLADARVAPLQAAQRPRAEVLHAGAVGGDTGLLPRVRGRRPRRAALEGGGTSSDLPVHYRRVVRPADRADPDQVRTGPRGRPRHKGGRAGLQGDEQHDTVQPPPHVAQVDMGPVQRDRRRHDARRQGLPGVRVRLHDMELDTAPRAGWAALHRPGPGQRQPPERGPGGRPEVPGPERQVRRGGGAVRHVVLRAARHQGGGRAAVRLQDLRAHRRLGGDIALGNGM